MFTYKKYCYLLVPVWVLAFSITDVGPVWSLQCDFTVQSSSVSPSSIRAPSGITTAQTLTYSFSTTPTQNTTLVSPIGTFWVGGTLIGENNTQISVDIINARGRKSETVTIFPSITQRALSMGSTKMTYIRVFSCGIYPYILQAEIAITTEAAADFRITKMQLYFQNRQPVITIKRNDTSLRTYAQLNYVGSGLLQGYWEVDGNFLSNVNQTTTFGTSITIESPAPPVLPVFTSGTHRIRLVITNPSQDIPFPEIRYYVASEEPKPVEVKKLATLSILFPHNRSIINYEPITFLWTMRDGVATYFLEFFLKGEEKTLFSAYTKNSSYRIPETILKTFFSSGKTYLWRVRGFDALNSLSAESTLFTFTIRE